MGSWPRRGLALLGLTLLLNACSFFDGPEAATPVLEAQLPPEPTPTPGPPQPGDAIDLRWTQVTPQAHETEAARPFQDAVAEFDTEGEDLWRLYTVHGDSASRLELETRRFLTLLHWTADNTSLIAEYYTRYEGRPQDFIAGAQRRTPGAPGPAWDVRLPGPALWPGLNGDLFGLANASVGGQAFLQADGSLWALESDLENIEAAGWSPDGGSLLLAQYDPARDEPGRARYYVTQPFAAQGFFVGVGSRPAWAPDSRRLAFATQTGVSLFDVASRRIETIPSPVTAFLGFLHWSDDGRYLVARDGLVDVAARRFVVVPTNRDIIDAALSSDGRWLAVTLEFNQGSSTTCDGPGLRNRTYLIDVATGAERALFDCDRFLARLRWVDNERFLAYTHTCWACEGKSQLFLVSIAGEPSTTALNADFGYWVRFDVSPDGSQILLSGDEVRVYTPQGRLIRRIPVEPGYTVTDVRWAPDGSGFAFLVGPKDVVFV
jgi:dipeptidyl aminopeptidase/acylaminoacyl peptidase